MICARVGRKHFYASKVGRAPRKWRARTSPMPMSATPTTTSGAEARPVTGSSALTGAGGVAAGAVMAGALGGFAGGGGGDVGGGGGASGSA